MAPGRQVSQFPQSAQRALSAVSAVFGGFTVLEVSPISTPSAVITAQVPKSRKVKSFYSILEKLTEGKIKELKGYKSQLTYLILGYSPEKETILDAKFFKTKETYQKIVKSYQKRGLLPLILPNPVKVTKETWEEYRRAKNGHKRVKVIKEAGLLTDSAILQLRVLVIDVDSRFEKVSPVWEELKNRLGIQQGYTVVKTKSGRFRLYLFLEPSEVKDRKFYLSAKHAKRAQELVAIILAYFEKRKLKADHTFARLNHPIFPEDVTTAKGRYEIIEQKDGYAGKLYSLYKMGKQLQKEEGLWYLGKVYLPDKFWGKKERKPKKKKECEIIKAPAFRRVLSDRQLDLFELWKRAVVSLFKKHSTYRYIHVIQPAIGWAKYLELPKEDVYEFLVSLLGEEKEKDIEKGWKYSRELEFHIPDNLGEWAGKRREEWEKEVRTFLKANNGVAFRQTLIKEVFKGQEWLTDLIMWGMVKKGMVEWRKYWEKEGRGRKPYVFALKAESEVLPKAVGAENYVPTWLSEKTIVRKEKKKTQNNNSSPEEQRSGLVEVGKGNSFFLSGGDDLRKVCGGGRAEGFKGRKEKGLEEGLVELEEKYLVLRCDFQRRSVVLERGEKRMVASSFFWKVREVCGREFLNRLVDLLYLFRVVEYQREKLIEFFIPSDLAGFLDLLQEFLD